MIEKDQTYRYADPRETIRIRITSYTPGDARAHVVDADTGKRPRQILARTLHATPTTKTGAPRKTGYIRESS
ncbi:hypothetical protein ACIQMY_20835 [Streptomyces sp. NPDC091368]|uniref:hypothetical protein n=1 Tax=Streptomyces sp. NPDC091368 TaxID=3365993 RepID=UPI003814F76F